MEGIFYFGDQLRWNLGFETPNIAGALVAVAIAFLLPFTSKIPDKKRRRFAFAVLSAVEILLWFVLAKHIRAVRLSLRAFVLYVVMRLCFYGPKANA